MTLKKYRLQSAAQSQKDRYSEMPVSESPGGVTLRDSGGTAVTGGGGTGQGDREDDADGVSVWEGEKVLEPEGGGGRGTKCVHLTQLNCAPENR